jgi:predicted ATP-grasp superfamily ATP-dependent carboligase
MIYEYSLISGTNLELRNGRSMFELSGEFGSRGGEESLPEELFARMKLGIQINDMWFRKVKRR